MKNYVFDIQRFSVKDGPGIRTTVFVKGCPLNCVWCHNPESKEREPILAFDKTKCIGCGKCVSVCQSRAISAIGQIDREKCSLCKDCAEGCVGALEILGEEARLDGIIETVLKDKPFYDNSGGGLTVSGGEPMYSPVFTNRLLKEAKKQAIHTCTETCGFGKWSDFEELLPFTDLFLFDIKETDPTLHKKYTGSDNSLILQNLYNLNRLGAKIILRCPIIPGYNDRDEHFESIANIANELENVLHVEVLPYHPLGKSKSELIGQVDPIDLPFPSNNIVKEWIDKISSYTSKKVIKS